MFLCSVMNFRYLIFVLFYVTHSSGVDGKRFYITRYGWYILFYLFKMARHRTNHYGFLQLGECADCSSRRTNYNWCRGEDWAYCSLTSGYSTRNKKCRDECGFHGYSYMWCYLEEGGWDHCSLIQDTSLTEYEYYGVECDSYCDISECNKCPCSTLNV